SAYGRGGTDSKVQGNNIGIGVDGKTPLFNGRDGVRLEDASLNTIGGIEPNAGNVISGNMRNGIEIVSDAVSDNFISVPVASQNCLSNVIRGNFIGTDASGLFSVLINESGKPELFGNTENGILLQNQSTDPSVTV